MAETRKKYNREFKVEAVKLLEESGKSSSQVEEELGISRGCLSRWQREMRSEKNGMRVFPGNGNARDEELARLRKELAIVKEEREILRKAVAIFSKPTK